MRHPHGETIIRLRATPTLDQYSGEQTGTNWTTPDTLGVPRCAIDDSKTRETNTTDRNAVVTDFVIWPDAHYDIQSGDRLIVRGLTCEIVGRPSTPVNPFNGDAPGMEIAANIWEG